MIKQKLHEAFSHESIPKPDKIQSLILQYSIATPETTKSILESLWSNSNLIGGYAIDQLSRDTPKRHKFNTGNDQPDTLYGIANLPDGSTAGCLSRQKKTRNGEETRGILQLEFGICLDNLLPFLRDQNYHLSFNSHQLLSKRLDHWLTSIASLIHQKHPFLLGVIPHSDTWSNYDAITKYGIPDYDHNGYILPENGELIWYPPQWPQTIEPTGYLDIIKRAETVERNYDDGLGIGFFMELPDGTTPKKAISLCKHIWTHPDIIGPTANSPNITEPHEQERSNFADYENQVASLEYHAGDGVVKLPSGILIPCDVTIYGFDDFEVGLIVGVALAPITLFQPEFIQPEWNCVRNYYPEWKEKIFSEYNKQQLKLQTFLTPWAISIAKHCYKHTPFLSAQLNDPQIISESGVSFYAGNEIPQDDSYPAKLLTFLPKDNTFHVYAPLIDSSLSPRKVTIVNRAIRNSAPLQITT